MPKKRKHSKKSKAKSNSRPQIYTSIFIVLVALSAIAGILISQADKEAPINTKEIVESSSNLKIIYGELKKNIDSHNFYPDDLKSVINVPNQFKYHAKGVQTSDPKNLVIMHWLNSDRSFANLLLNNGQVRGLKVEKNLTTSLKQQKYMLASDYLQQKNLQNRKTKVMLKPPVFSKLDFNNQAQAKPPETVDNTPPQVNEEITVETNTFKESDYYIPIENAKYSSLDKLAAGSELAQKMQRELAQVYPLELKLPLSGITFRLIPASKTFTFRSVSQPFYIGKYEITQEQYEKIMGKNPSYNKAPNNPVEQVSWIDAKTFISILEKYEALPKGSLSLPTQKEWEYACRAGTTRTYYTGNLVSNLQLAGWYDANTKSRSMPVGLKLPNAWGIYDTHGNVWEWGETALGEKQVTLGGSWSNDPNCCRSNFRGASLPNTKSSSVGFRIIFKFPELKQFKIHLEKVNEKKKDKDQT